MGFVGPVWWSRKEEDIPCRRNQSKRLNGVRVTVLASSRSEDLGAFDGVLRDSVLETKWKREERERSAAERQGKCDVCAQETVTPSLASPYSAQSLARRMVRRDLARRRMDEFLAWFSGDFDNYAQVAQERALGLFPREGGGHEHIHCQLQNLDSTLGNGHIFAKYYFDGNPSKIFRSRLYRVSISDSSASGELEMRIYRFYAETESRLREHNFDVTKVDLTKDDLYEWLEGCEVFWYKGDGNVEGLNHQPHFIGYMEGGGCSVFSREIQGMIHIKDDLIMTQKDLWVNDRGFTDNGDYVYGNRRGIHYKMQRVLPGDELWWTVTGSPPSNEHV
uniref:Uncharacterized protein n=1 Tax=Compsopogon caeruleus TaxID=31354 RepID=A0A7S1XBU0_9RHOD